MSEQMAQQVLFSIAGGAAVIWLIGFTLTIWAFRSGASPASDNSQANPYAMRHEKAEPRGRGVVTGEVVVDGQPAELSQRAAAQLAAVGMPGTLRIVERRDDHVVFERGHAMNRGMGLMFCKGGELFFKAEGEARTRIRYEVKSGSGRWMLWLAGVFVTLGLVALGAGCWALHTFVVPSARPGIRMQVVQMIQVIHFLWPPFLFVLLYKLMSRSIPRQLETLLHNLPYATVATAQAGRRSW